VTGPPADAPPPLLQRAKRGRRTMAQMAATVFFIVLA
jgi:hypothetical protein